MKFNADKAATVLIEALINGIESAALNNAVSESSIKSWQKRLLTDQYFYSVYQEKLTKERSEQISRAIIGCIKAIDKLALEPNSENGIVLEALAKVLEVLWTIENKDRETIKKQYLGELLQITDNSEWRLG